MSQALGGVACDRPWAERDEGPEGKGRAMGDVNVRVIVCLCLCVCVIYAEIDSSRAQVSSGTTRHLCL